MNDTTNVTAAEPEKTAPRSFSKADKVMAAACAIFAFVFIEFAVMNTLGFFTTAVYFSILTASIVFMRKKGCTFTRLNVIFAAVLYLFTFVFSITDSGLIKFLDSVFLFCGGAYFVYSAASGQKNIERYLPFAMIKSLFEFPFSRFGTQAVVAKQSVNDPKTAAGIRNVILGLVLAIPLTLIVGILLISADQGMANIFDAIVDSSIFTHIVKHAFYIVLALPCSLYLFGLFYANTERNNLRTLDDDRCWAIMERFHSIPNGIIYTSVTPICILYVIFFISQASYFLSAFSGDLPDGYSYAEYARRGFFELLTVTVINLSVICFISIFSKQCASEKPKGLKFYTSALSVSTLILITVAMSKMVMYISQFGLTRLRLYTSWFMVLCAVIFVLIIIKQFRYKFRLAGWCTGVFTLMFAVLCFGRPDWIVAKYNIGMYSAGYLEELDSSALLEMSDDAILAGLDADVLTPTEAYHCSDVSSNKIMKRMNIPSLILSSRLDGSEIEDDGFRYPDYFKF